MSWSSTVIDEMCRLKAAGRSFEDAWRIATMAHPPSARDQGYRATLFPEDAEELSTLEWLHIAAGDAWHGRRPVLRHLINAVSLLADSMDDSRAAVHRRPVRAA